jgi:hypothetical protein
MRIRCFSEARGVFEEGQISFEPQMYCFGGGGGGGGGGGSSMDSMDDDPDTGDFGVDTGSGQRGGRDDGGGGGNDNDSSRQEIAARAGVPADTIVGSGPQGSGVVTSAGGPVTSARSVAQAAGDLGISDDEVRARINAAASAVPGPSAAAAFDQAIAEQEAYDAAFNIFDTPQFQELQTTNISLMDQLEDLQQGINMRQSEFDALSARYDELAPLADTVPGLNTQLLDLNTQLNTRANEITGLQTRLDDTFKSYTDLQGQFGAQSDQLTALDEQFGLSQQQIQDQAARIAEQEEAARRNRILGIAGVSPVASSAMTQGDVYNMFGGPGPGSSVEMQNRILGGSGGFSTRPSVTDPNRSILSLGGREYSFDNTVPGNQRSYTEISSPSIGGVTGALLDTPEFQAEFDAFNSLQKMPAGGVDTRSFAEKVAAGEIPEDIFVYGASAPSGDEILTFGLDDFNTGITPNPIESQISIANALKNLDLQAEEEQIFTPINMQLPSFIGAGINLIGGALNAAQKYGGGNIPGYAQDVMNRPGGAPIMANAPMMSPAQPSAFLETLMAASDRQPVGPYSEAEGVPDVLGGFGPNQLSFLPGEPDNIYVGDPRGIEQAQMLDPNVQVLDENYFSQGQELSDRGGDQAAPPALTLPDPVTQECPEGYTRDGSGICVYEGQPRVGVTPYTPMAPVEFSYTGLPSLAPRTLTPTAPNLSFLNRR